MAQGDKPGGKPGFRAKGASGRPGAGPGRTAGKQPAGAGAGRERPAYGRPGEGRATAGPGKPAGGRPAAGKPGGFKKAGVRPAAGQGKPAPAGPKGPRGPLDPRVAELLQTEGLLDKRAYDKALGGGERGPGTPRETGAGRPRPAAPAGPARGKAFRVAGGPAVQPFKAGPRTAPKQVTRSPRPQPSEPERLQKVLAHAGISSRRAAEEMIQAGRVKVNGEVVTVLGTKVVQGRDRIEVDGRPIGQAEQLVYVVLNKPRNYVTTLYDPQNRPTVLDLLEGVPGRVFPVGRLDFDTEGLLLLTNDGEVAHALMHPAKQIWKTYVARVRGVPAETKLRLLEKGVELEDGMTAPARARLLGVKSDRKTGNQIAWVELSIHEGRNRQVRRMLEYVGHEVIGLQRTRLGPLRLVALAPGEYRYLSLRDIRALRDVAGLNPEPPRELAEVPETRQGAGARPFVQAAGAPAGATADERPAAARRPGGFRVAGGARPLPAPRAAAGRPGSAQGGPPVGTRPAGRAPAPGKAEGGPGRAFGGPRKIEGGPSKIEGGPSKTAGRPGSAQGGPPAGTRPAGRGPAPGKTAGGPGKSFGGRGKTMGGRGKTMGGPGKAAGGPGKAAGAEGRNVGAPTGRHKPADVERAVEHAFKKLAFRAEKRIGARPEPRRKEK